MGQPIDRTPHTLAQLARRAGISEGRARALFAAMQAGGSASGLPRPDRTDADGRPLWWPATIDAWCVRTGRDVDVDALWVFAAPTAARPAAELRRGVMTLAGPGGPLPFFVVVWDTEAGHVVYLQPLGETGGQHKDWLAACAAQLLEPRWWGSAVIVMPVEDDLVFFPQYRREPICYLYRLRIPDADERDAGRRGVSAASGRAAGGRAGGREGGWGGVRRWLGRTEPDVRVARAPRAEWVTHVDLADIARVVGRPIPAWISETTSVANAERALAFGDRTFTTAVDTVTGWPRVQEVLGRAVEIGLPEAYPAGFAALAVDAAAELDRIRHAHSNTPEVGVGWYLVCRPARPAPPIELEQRIVGARYVTDLELVGKELSELRAVEGELDIDDPRGEVYATTIEALAGQLHETARQAAKQAGTRRDSDTYVPLADDELQRFSAPWAGPVVDAWRKTLVEVDDLDAVLRLRRVRRVLRDDPVEQVQAAYRDPAGRYVLMVTRSHGADWFVAEWPTTLAATSSWTEATMLAGDGHTTVTVLLALTSTHDGGMRVDPVPLPPHCDRDAFAYGYGGGTPATTYSALLRVALGDEVTIDAALRRSLDRGPDRQSASQLRRAIETTDGPLRLSWPQVKLWARADVKRATTPPAEPAGGTTA